MRKAICISIALLLTACAAPADKADQKYEQAMRDGNYSLIVMEPEGGGPAMAVLDMEGDKYELAPDKGATEKVRQKGLPPGEAIMSADRNLTGSGVMLRAVMGEGGLIIGYEVYSPDSLDTSPPPGPESEAVLLPNLLRIDYTAGPGGRPRIRIITLPLSGPGSTAPQK